MIYLYYGENDYMIKRSVKAVEAAFEKEHGQDAVQRLDCSEIDPQKLIAELVNINMFAPERLLILSDLDKNKAAWSELGENLARIPDETTVIIAASSPDKRTKTFKELARHDSREFKLLKGRELSEWLAREFKAVQLDHEPAALDELIVLTAGDQWRMSAELGKLKSLQGRVTVDVVRSYVEPNLEANAFNIFERVLLGDRKSAMDELSKLRQLEDANKFLGLLSSQAFALAAAIYGQGHDNAASELKVHPFQLSRMQTLARNLGDQTAQRKRMRQISEALATADAKIKLSRSDEAWAMIIATLGRI